MKKSRRAILAPLTGAPKRAIVCFNLALTVARLKPNPYSVIVDPDVQRLIPRLLRRGYTLACITVDPALDARKTLGSPDVLVYGHSGAEVLEVGSRTPLRDPDLDPSIVPDFVRPRRARIKGAGLRIADHDGFVALHWRWTRDPIQAQHVAYQIVRAARQSHLEADLGNQYVHLRPPNAPNKGDALRAVVGDRSDAAVLYAGDDIPDEDAFVALHELVEEGRVRAGVRVAVRSDAYRPELVGDADLVVNGVGELAYVLRLLADAA